MKLQTCKKILILYLFIMFSQILNAQNVLRIQYHCLFRNVEEATFPYSETRVLEINDSTSAFFWIDPLEDGIPFLNESLPYRIYKNYPKQNEITFIGGISNLNFYYTEKMPEFDWSLQDGDSTICNYVCHKALTLFRGRTWKVWYTEELPYDDGPWKLKGLPGLILKAEDANGDFSFTAIGIKKCENMSIKMSLKGFCKTSRKNYQEDVTEYRRDPEAFFNATHNVKIHRIYKDGQHKPAPKTPCFLEH